MKKTLFIFILSLFASVEIIFASYTSVDGIYYDFNDTDLTATVTYRGSLYSTYSNEYSGNVAIPETVTYSGKTYRITSIGDRAFYECSALTSVTIPNSVTSIGIGAFYKCSSLTSVTIPNSVTSIGSSVFYNCSSLTSVTIPNSVTSIGSSVFYNCSSLTSVTIPNSVTSIGSEAFSDCSGLKSITIPNNITSIGHRTFYNCSSLTEINIPNGVTSIGNLAFSNCSALKSISIPKSVTSFGTTPFYGCSNITSIEWNVKKAGDYYVAQKTGDVTTAPFYDIRSQIVSFTFGEGVQHIPAYICYGMSKLVSVSMPSTLLSIGKYAFCGCSVLSSIILPSSVNEIGSYSFWGCSSLAYITCKANTPPKLAIGSDANCFPMEGSYALKYLKCSIPCGTLDAYEKSKWDSYMRDFIEETIYSLTLSSGNPSSGVAKLVSRPDCESAIITAIPNEGCKFVKWSDGNTQATRYLELTGDVTLTAEFVKEGYTIHVNQDCSSTLE